MEQGPLGQRRPLHFHPICWAKRALGAPVEHVDVRPASTPILVELPRPTALRADDLTCGPGWSMIRSLERHLRSHLSNADGYVYRDYCGLLELPNSINELCWHLKPHHELPGEASGGRCNWRARYGLWPSNRRGPANRRSRGCPKGHEIQLWLRLSEPGCQAMDYLGRSSAGSVFRSLRPCRPSPA